MRLKLIGCEVLFREMCWLVARSRYHVDVEFLPKGLHDLGGKSMADELQKIVDRVQAGSYDAILLGYGLCGNGLHGVAARHTPLVLPKAHDCIALLLGSRQRYLEYFNTHPGTYFRSTGWLERGKGLKQLTQTTVGMDVSNLLERTLSVEQMIEKYGEDNGRYLFEEFTRYRGQYQRLTYIETGVEPDGRFEEQARREAVERGWVFEKLAGSLLLLSRLVNAEWTGGDFLVVQPGERIAASHDNDIVKIESVKTDGIKKEATAQ